MIFAWDKVLHTVVGFIISAVVTPISMYFGLSPWAGFLAASVAGMLKEVRDRMGRGEEDFMDFWWTGLGGVVPSLIAEVWWLQ